MSEEAEKSFFTLCELDLLKIDKYTIEQDLTRWGFKFGNCRLKGDKFHIDVIAPYEEMQLEIKEVPNDTDFFGKNTARINISNKIAPAELMGYFKGRSTTFAINTNTTHILFSTPYFYPHNFYNLYNRDYLYKKILYSVNFMQYLLTRYREYWSNGIPFIHIKQTRESKTDYEIDIIVKDYIIINYITTDVNTSTVYLHILIDTNKKSGKADAPNKYHQITLKIPRIVRNGNVYFKFKANSS